MANRAPNTDGVEPETSSEALLDELVRALARQIAERVRDKLDITMDDLGEREVNYKTLRNKTRPAPRSAGGHEGFRMSAAAIYARYSSDLQREASIEDQNRICRERAAKEGWSI
jgi:hypothetical protein